MSSKRPMWRRAFPLLLLSACASSPTAESPSPIDVPPPAASPSTAGEGQPLCADHVCWEFPQTPSSLTSVHASSPTDIWAVGEGGAILHSASGGKAWRVLPPASNAALRGVFAVDAKTAWAVGDAGTILRFDGAAWAAVRSPAPEVTLTGVFASSATDAFAVGHDETSGTILHWDGASWARVPGNYPPLYAVNGSGAKNVWAAGGDTESPQFVRWDGSRWDAVDATALLGNRRIYGPAHGVWVIGPDEAIATTGGLNTSSIVRFNGAWTVEYGELTSTSGDLLGIGRGRGGEPWVAANPPLAFDGAKWRPVGTATYNVGISSLWTTDDDVTVVAGYWGLLEASLPPGPRPAEVKPIGLDGWGLSRDGLYRFESGRWTRKLTASTGSDGEEYFADAFAYSESDILALSQIPDGGGRQRSRLQRFDGTKWTVLPIPYGAWGEGAFARTPNGDVWLANGDTSGTLVHVSPTGEQLPVPTCPQRFDERRPPTGRRVWAAGDSVFAYEYDAIYRLDPSGSCTFFDTLTSLTGDEVTAVRAVSATDIWIAITTESDAKKNSIAHFDGVKWTDVGAKAEQPITSIVAFSTNDVWMTMVPGRIVHWDGASLRDVATPKDPTFTAIWGRSPSELRFVASAGRVARYVP